LDFDAAGIEPHLRANLRLFDSDGKRVLAESGALIHAPVPLSFVAASQADYASYRTFYADAPASLR
ncbi:MAG: hypothetical protein RR763_19790, partial [Massilia sp.]